MSEPEVALVFTPEPWVEELHRHLADHGGARVRSLVVEPDAVRHETYDVLVVGHRWVALTRALVDDVHARGRTVVGVFDHEEPAGRRHLLELGVDATVESDAAPSTFVAVIASTARRRGDDPEMLEAVDRRSAALIVVGGAPGSGRTEIAVHLASALRATRVALVDADDVAPAVAQRLALPIEPNLRTAIEAVEHRRGDLAHSILHADLPFDVVTGIPNPAGWSQVRPAEVMRVVDAVGADHDVVVADGAGSLEEIGSAPRGRNATARALVADADALVAVCDATPVGVSRLLTWIADANALAPNLPLVAVVKREPSSRFQRGELHY
jgi:MinD superfamily P-loop ATPase